MKAGLHKPPPIKAALGHLLRDSHNPWATKVDMYRKETPLPLTSCPLKCFGRKCSHSSYACPSGKSIPCSEWVCFSTVGDAELSQVSNAVEYVTMLRFLGFCRNVYIFYCIPSLDRCLSFYCLDIKDVHIYAFILVLSGLIVKCLHIVKYM